MTLERMREVCERATPGWRRAGSVEKYHVFIHYPEGLAGPVCGERVLLRFNEHFPYEGDAAFAATFSPAAVAALLDVVEAAKQITGDGWHMDKASLVKSGDMKALIDALAALEAIDDE